MSVIKNTARSGAGWEYSCQALISRIAGRYPDKTALTFKDQSTDRSFTYTYRQLIGKANQLAALLIDQGIQPENIVALVIDRSPDMIIALLAIMRSGASYLPIDPAYPTDLIEFMLEDSSANLILTSRKYGGRFRSHSQELYIEDCHEQLPSYPEEDPDTLIDSDSLAYTLYTSGSTGRPKGVQIEQHSLLNFLVSMQQQLGITLLDRFLAVTTICFDISGLELYLPLIAGAELVLTDSATAKDARLLLDLVRTEQVSMMQATPSTWKLMLEAGWDKPLPLKVLCGGEAMTTPLAEQLGRLGSKLWNLYGPTETTIWSTIKEITPANTAVSIGWPIANTQIYILDENQRPVPQGKAGEICIAGEGVARGYLNRPSLNAERFVPNPFAKLPGSRMYRTGDLGMWLPDGQIQLYGRIDLQIKIRGFRIEPEEIETLLIRQPGVRDAVVKGWDEQLVAYVIPKTVAASELFVEDQLVNDHLLHDLRQALQSKLPEYMVPSHIVIMRQLPLTANGKVDRKALPDPRQIRTDKKVGLNTPRTDSEKLVAKVWSMYLHQQPIGLYDDYFEMGGNSMSALRIMAFLEKETGQRLPLSSLLKAPTVEKLAALLDANLSLISWVPLVLIKKGADRPPLYIVHGHGMNVIGFNNLAKYMHADQPVYGFQPKGLNGVDEPHDTIVAMAKDYVNSMLHVDPDGPYYLAGYSYGGIVAFEMAKQLKAKGKNIGMLAMIDTYANERHENESWKDKTMRKIRRQFPKFRFVLKNFRQYPGETLQYQWEFLVRKTREFADLFYRPGQVMTPEEIVDAQYAKAYAQYYIHPYDGDIDLFKVKTRLYFLDDLEYMGWNLFIQNEITIHEMSGDHLTFMLPPNDKLFAALLQKTMDKCIKQMHERSRSAPIVGK